MIENDTALRAFLETAFGGSPKVHGRVPRGARGRGRREANDHDRARTENGVLKELKGRKPTGVLSVIACLRQLAAFPQCRIGANEILAFLTPANLCVRGSTAPRVQSDRHTPSG